MGANVLPRPMQSGTIPAVTPAQDTDWSSMLTTMMPMMINMIIMIMFVNMMTKMMDKMTATTG